MQELQEQYEPNAWANRTAIEVCRLAMACWSRLVQAWLEGLRARVKVVCAGALVEAAMQHGQ